MNVSLAKVFGHQVLWYCRMWVSLRREIWVDSFQGIAVPSYEGPTHPVAGLEGSLL
jgi:hypothetical protein